MDLKLTHIHDDDKNFMVRLCIRVADSVVHTTTSVIKECDECGAKVWVDEAQPIPPMPEGLTCDGTVNLCFFCLMQHQAYVKEHGASIEEAEEVLLPDLEYVKHVEIVVTTDEDRQS